VQRTKSSIDMDMLVGRHTREIVNAIAGTTPPMKKERMEAELDATKCHLADMRRLVFDAPHQEQEDDTFSKN
jgi:hypothetical protein